MSRRSASLRALEEAATLSSRAEGISHLFLVFPINGLTACRASSLISSKASASCRKRFSTSSKREKLARTNWPLMGSIILRAPLLPKFSAFSREPYSLKESTQRPPGQYLRTYFLQSNSLVQKRKKQMRNSERGLSKLNWMCSAKQMTMTKMLYELMPPLYPSFNPAASRMCFTTSMASVSFGLKLKLFCMKAEETRPVLWGPAVLRVMSNLMREGSWPSVVQAMASLITGILAVRMALQQATHSKAVRSLARSLMKYSSTGRDGGVSRMSMSELGRVTPVASEPKMSTPQTPQSSSGYLALMKATNQLMQSTLIFMIESFACFSWQSLLSSSLLKTLQAAFLT